MKLRIKGNSIRLRLSKSDVTNLDNRGYLEERTAFIDSVFTYALKRVDTGNELTASYHENKITVFIPSDMINNWPSNDIVGFDTNVSLTSTDSLYILVEKDFICLDETTEDQSDNYENPNKTC